MLEDTLLRTADLDSIGFMYLSGRRWSAGDIVGSTHFNQHIILSGREYAPEYEFRKIEDRSWWRTRGTDGWRVGSYPVNLERVVETEKFWDGARSFIQGVSEAGLRDPEVIDTPLGTTVETHLVSGRVHLGAIRGLGMELLGDHADEIMVTFHAWIEQDTGYVARMVFEGVPPAIPPLGILYLFDHNVMKAGGIPEPHPDAMAPLITDLAEGQPSSPAQEPVSSYAPIVVTDPNIRVGPLAPSRREESVDMDAPNVDTTEPSDDLVNHEDASSKMESPESVAAAAVPNPPVVEHRDGLSPGWTMYVLPVDGYSIEFPAGWEVSALPEDGGSLLKGSDPVGHVRWEVRRFAGTYTIFNLLQDRLDSLESEG